MNNIVHSNINKIPEEIALVSNSSRYKIDIFTCTSNDASYIFRRRSNQDLICKVDKNFNIIGQLESLILVNDLETAFNRVKEHSDITGWIDDYFDF